MLKYSGIGLMITVLALITGFITNDWELSMKIIGGAALIPLLLVGVFSGAFSQDGQHVRAFYLSETKETRKERNKMSSFFFFVSLPNLIILVAFIVISLTN